MVSGLTMQPSAVSLLLMLDDRNVLLSPELDERMLLADEVGSTEEELFTEEESLTVVESFVAVESPVAELLLTVAAVSLEVVSVMSLPDWLSGEVMSAELESLSPHAAKKVNEMTTDAK